MIRKPETADLDRLDRRLPDRLDEFATAGARALGYAAALGVARFQWLGGCRYTARLSEPVLRWQTVRQLAFPGAEAAHRRAP